MKRFKSASVKSKVCGNYSAKSDTSPNIHEKSS
jgi:hypothetical protein